MGNKIVIRNEALNEGNSWSLFICSDSFHKDFHLKIAEFSSPMHVVAKGLDWVVFLRADYDFSQLKDVLTERQKSLLQKTFDITNQLFGLEKCILSFE